MIDARPRTGIEMSSSSDPQAEGPQVIPDPRTISDPAELALLIDECRTQGLVAYRTSLKHAVMVGKLLLRAKELVPHGEFTAWLLENCQGMSERTARAYMRVAKAGKLAARAIDPKRQPVAVLTLTGALKKMAKPRSSGGGKKSSETATQPRRTEADPDEESTDDEQDADGSDHDEEERPETRRNRSEAASQRHETGQADQEGSEAGEAEEGLDDEAEEAEDELDDEATWLASMPIRAQLSDPTVFDEQAKLWRDLQPQVDQLREAHTPSTEEFSQACSRSFYQLRYSHLVAALLGVKPPQDWVLCPACKGTGVNRFLQSKCTACKAEGFEITHHGQPTTDELEVAKPVIKTI
jgi:hypothetical protein